MRHGVRDDGTERKKGEQRAHEGDKKETGKWQPY